MRCLGRGRRGRAPDRSEINRRCSCVVSDSLFSGREIENRSPVDREGITSGIIVLGLLIDCKVEAVVSSGEAELEGILEGEGIRERNLTTGLVGRSKQQA